MKKEYDTFVSSLDELPDGRQIELVIRDLAPGPRQYDSRWVSAVIYNSPEKTADADVLWVRFPLGFLHAEPYAIKVLKVLGDYKPQQQKVVRPYQIYSYQAPL